MIYDPKGPGAAADDPLVRRGKFRESTRRLARHAADAETKGAAKNKVAFGHGVSVTSPAANQMLARDPADAIQALRRAFENAGFEVRYTPTGTDADHHTVLLPKPLTDADAARFNSVLGRVP